MKPIKIHSSAVPGGGKPVDPNGPAPMDVDCVEKGFSKGKGEQKGNFKGKGKGFWGAGAFGIPYWGRGRGGNGYQKGRGKKGKGKSKGGSKGKKGKGKIDQNQCRVCYEYGHWSNDCPRRHVNQVQQQTPVPPNVHSGFTGANQTPTCQQSSATASVRRIFNLGASLSSNLSSSSSSYVRVIIEEVDEQQQHEIGQKCLVISDSGSDVSLLPMQFGGRTEGNCKVQLRDCQGGALKVLGQKNAGLLVQSAQGEEIELQHPFVVGDVKHGVLSLGELYRSGWHVQPGNPLYLTSPDGTVQIPVKFQQNSFAIVASVCRIEHGLEEPNQDLAVRAVMRVADALSNFVRFGIWETEKNCPYTTRLGSLWGFQTILTSGRSIWNNTGNGNIWPRWTVHDFDNLVLSWAQFVIFRGIVGWSKIGCWTTRDSSVRRCWRTPRSGYWNCWRSRSQRDCWSKHPWISAVGADFGRNWSIWFSHCRWHGVDANFVSCIVASGSRVFGRFQQWKQGEIFPEDQGRPYWIHKTKSRCCRPWALFGGPRTTTKIPGFASSTKWSREKTAWNYTFAYETLVSSLCERQIKGQCQTSYETWGGGIENVSNHTAWLLVFNRQCLHSFDGWLLDKVCAGCEFKKSQARQQLVRA